MAELKDFMFIFRYEPIENYQPSPEEMAQEEKDWCTFIGGIAGQACFRKGRYIRCRQKNSGRNHGGKSHQY